MIISLFHSHCFVHTYIYIYIYIFLLLSPHFKLTLLRACIDNVYENLYNIYVDVERNIYSCLYITCGLFFFLLNECIYI